MSSRPAATPVAARDDPSRVRDQPVEREMHKSYIDYAMSVIVGRALPDGRDGLKPVHRRILWSMWESGVTHEKAYRKSARTVGDVLGKYHPHGELAVYDALVRMAQPFSLRYPLVDGQGNFGSIDGDSPAAMRYTEARLAAPAAEMLLDVEKETVGWTDNFDGTMKEPLVLPSKLPNLLVNGSAGIAVGMATNMPPHNLGEVVDALLLVLERPSATLDEILRKLPGPDFPTGGLLSASSGIREAYETGRGTLRVRGKAEIRERDGRDEIVITEIPYEVNKTSLLELIADLVKTKRIDGITDLRDESDRRGTSVVLELRRDAPAEIVLNRIYEHTPLETSFGVINLCLIGGRPKVLSLKELLETHLSHRREILTKRSISDLAKAEARLHILEGFLTAIDHIDDVIRIIRKSADAAAAEASLMGKFLLSSEQAKAVLDMRLARLTALERESVQKEKAEKDAEIRRLKEILGSVRELDRLIALELADLKTRFGDARRTQIVPTFTERTLEDLIPDTEVVVLVTRDGYIKRLPLDQYRRQRRGGKGLIRMETKEEDYVIRTFVTRTHSNVLFFTNLGRVYQRKAYELPEGSRHSKGKALVNLLPLKGGEKVQTLLPLRDLESDGWLLFATRRGLVKRTGLDQFQNIRTNGIQAVLLEEGDELVDVALLADPRAEAVLATRSGQLVRFPVADVRAMGRATYGVIGVRLSVSKGDRVVTMAPVDERFPSLLTITSTGFGKRSPVDEYRETKRGAKGVRTIRTGGRNGEVVAVLPTSKASEVLVTTQRGITIRLAVSSIREQGRNTMGVRVIRIEPGDEVKDAVLLTGAAEEVDGASGEVPPGAGPPPEAGEDPPDAAPDEG